MSTSNKERGAKWRLGCKGMKRFELMETKEREEIIELFTNWLKNYTHDVIVKVMEQKNEIINNEFAMNLLRELYKREQKENIEFERSIKSLFCSLDEFRSYDAHNHPLTHSKSYRDILRDMYFA